MSSTAEPSRYAVPLDVLDGVRVEHARQVEQQAPAGATDAGPWGGSLIPARGGGGSADCDGD